MTKKKKSIIISVIIAFVILMGVLAGLYIANKFNRDKGNSKVTISRKETSRNKGKTVETLTDIEKEIVGIDTTDNQDVENKEETYSDLYKEYLKLPEEEKEKIEVVPREQKVPFEKLEEIEEIIEEDNNNENEEEKVPERFNLAEKIDIKVENQGAYGLCWDFASIKSLETHLALKNIGTYDLSEMHLDYVESNLMYGSRTIHQGGNFSNFKNYIAETGVVLESDVPYREHTEEEYNKFSDMKKVVEVTETIDFPNMYKNEDFKHTDEEISKFRETVKKHIMKNGGLFCIIATPDYGTKYLNTKTNAECFLGDGNDLQRNREFHAVTIVGWDDNYSRENFNEEMRPTKDGAYIILNSWGTFLGNAGYYYVSYEDKYIENDLSGIVSTSMDNAYKINSIKNSILKDYLKSRYGHLFVNYNGEDYITKNALSNIRTLDLSNSNLFSLEGIEMFTNLYDINLSNNNIKNITPLTKLTSLSAIDLSNNNISDISPFSNMKTKSLYSINLANNKIKDVSVLNDIVNENEWATLNLDISNNFNVKGYEKINNICGLNISGCNIKDVSNLKNCEKLSSLIVANTIGIEGLENLPENLFELDISNCNIDKLPKIPNKISFLNLSNNNITTLDGIQNLENLYHLDVSGNSITDWSALKDITRGNPYKNETNKETSQNKQFYDDSWKEISIVAKNCNIEDITIFNNFNISTRLDLRDNKIKDISQFKNEKVYYINLSNNQNLTGLQKLSNVSTIFLNNCNISDISEVLSLENVESLSLENNNLTDITDISKLKYLSSLSVAGNKNLEGTITSDILYNLNVSDCNLDNNFDLSKVSNLSCLNLSKNTDISQISKIVDNIKSNYINLIIDNLDFEELEKINDNKYFYIEDVILTLNYNLSNDDNKIDLNQNKLLKREIMKNFANAQINIKNGQLIKNGTMIKIDDISQDSVEIKIDGWIINFLKPTIKIIFNPNSMKTKDTNTTNNIVKNTENVLKNINT